MVPGSKNVVRVNGRAVLTAESAITAVFQQNGKTPKTVMVIEVDELYLQCAKAIMRAGLWAGNDQSGALPTAGAFVKEVDAGFDADTYDDTYEASAKDRMW